MTRFGYPRTGGIISIGCAGGQRGFPAAATSSSVAKQVAAVLASTALLTARKAELVKLRFYAGLTTSQAAQALGVSDSTAEKDWAYARSWMRLEMSGAGENGIAE